MFKLSGAALIITACTYYGFYLSSNLYMRTRIIQSLITALHYIKAQMVMLQARSLTYSGIYLLILITAMFRKCSVMQRRH